MRIKRLKAQGFRNIDNADIEFINGANILIGENAQGKTNVIEAIYIFARGKSFRHQEDKELLGFGKEGFRISIEYEDVTGINTLEYAFFGRERRKMKNGYKINKLTDMIGNFRSVLFFPDDLLLVKAGPEERRAFLNVALSQCYPGYVNIYASYKKALENRNSLLRKASKGEYIDDNELLSWSESISEYAAIIYSKRKEYIKNLEVYAKKNMLEISDGKEDLSLDYESNIDEEGLSSAEIKERYISIFRNNIEKEKIVGTSLYGPHRDDIKISVGGKDARSYASQGQQRSIVLSIKLAEGEVIKEISGEYPVYLFDDVLSELDEKRKKFVLNGLTDKQILITSCENIEKYIDGAKVITVKGGKYI
ncbi:MAG: DNA replication/repair protein RecF [Clostridia bacterium]|nr:DNA replication/repair protein RecF [Clostridia bacterium]